MSLEIAIIGGSISGCITALLLERAGHKVRVYERSRADLIGRGGGIATSGEVIRTLQSLALVDDDFPSIPHTVMDLGKRTARHSRRGRCPWSVPLDMHCVHWSGLFQALRRQLDAETYRLNHCLVDVEHLATAEQSTQSAQSTQSTQSTHSTHSTQSAQSEPSDRRSLADAPRARHDGRYRLRFDEQPEVEADLVVFCDGFRSTGRTLMFPGIELDYRGLVIWRGVLEERLTASMPGAAEALDVHQRLSLASMPGSFITYLMPSESGDRTPGHRIVNWAVYLPVDANELPLWMQDRSGHRRAGTLPAGQFPLERENRLKALMRRELPEIFSAVIDASVDTQFQPLKVCKAPAHHAAGLCLVGDAAMPIQPLTGAGLYKALRNARSLAETLSMPSDRLSLHGALDRWSEAESEFDRRLFATGRSLEEAMIWSTPDLGISDTEAVRNWWSRAVRFPPEYSYLAQDGGERGIRTLDTR